MTAPTPAKPGTPNYVPLDGYSFIHVLTGAMMGGMGFSGEVAFAVHVAWEIAEVSLKKQMPQAFPSATIDSMPNKIGDTAVFMAGWWLGQKLQRGQR